MNNLRTNLELAQQQTTISEAGDLGQTLLDRQASLEAVTAERTALALQLERLEVGTSHHKTNTIVVVVSCTYLDTCVLNLARLSKYLTVCGKRIGSM